MSAELPAAVVERVARAHMENRFIRDCGDCPALVRTISPTKHSSRHRWDSACRPE
jgi:hypothetical protein